MKKRDILLGLMFILAAVLVVMNQFGIVSGISILDIILTVVLAGIMIKNIIRLDFFGIFFPAAFICILFDEQLKITQFTPWPALLTALLLSIGFSLIFRGPRKLWSFSWHSGNSFGNKTIETNDSKTIYCSTLFGDCIKYVNSSNFKKADIKATFGDVKVYFDKAVIPSGKADIYLSVNFGDVQLYIPRNWKIIDETHCFFGDLTCSDSNFDAISPVVTLHGNISFGDVRIIYVD